MSVTIYVRLPEEAVDTWRPVAAAHIDGARYRIVDQDYNRDIEVWEFEPGTVVRCEEIELYEGRTLCAIEASTA